MGPRHFPKITSLLLFVILIASQFIIIFYCPGPSAPEAFQNGNSKLDAIGVKEVTSSGSAAGHYHPSSNLRFVNNLEVPYLRLSAILASRNRGFDEDSNRLTFVIKHLALQA